jgi:phosphatidylglycerol:prolipoprotein diacylglycerol transferase
MYLLGFFLAYILARYRTKRDNLPWNKEKISDLIFFVALGAILGGRLGYMLFYTNGAFFSHPWSFFKIWEGGMSFHGGLLGVIIAVFLFAKKAHKHFLEVSDFLAPLVPLGLAAGRAGNFINGELWGRSTDMAWGIVFPNADTIPRHPSQLYELALEGLLLFVLLWWYASKPRKEGRISAFFLIGYALCRIVAECFREPDMQLGFLVFDSITMGQLLSLPMLVVGIWLWRGKRV